MHILIKILLTLLALAYISQNIIIMLASLPLTPLFKLINIIAILVGLLLLFYVFKPNIMNYKTLRYSILGFILLIIVLIFTYKYMILNNAEKKQELGDFIKKYTLPFSPEEYLNRLVIYYIFSFIIPFLYVLMY
jgi:hypothetical protein